MKECRGRRGRRTRHAAWRRRLTWALVLLAGQAAVGFADEGSLTTGVTGTLTASGLDNPRYVLSFPEVQSLFLAAARGPLAREKVDRALVGTPVQTENLLDLGLLRDEDGLLYLDYLLLTRQDQRAIYRVAEALGRDLADALVRRHSDLEGILTGYTGSGSRQDLAFILVAGFLMNWEGLALTSELGYRVQPEEDERGDRYLVHSMEVGAKLPSERQYSGSHSFPGPRLTFTTFGDGPSMPRINGIPDVFFGPAEEGLQMLEDHPALYAAVRGHLIAYWTEALTDAGDVMLALVDGPQSRAELAVRTRVAGPQLDATLELLQTTGYIAEDDSGYRNTVVVLTEDHREVVDGTLALGREVLTEWLATHHERIQEELSGLTPMTQGVPFNLVFSEVWHYIFGVASKVLAERGFYSDPYRPTTRHRGFVPLVWASSLYDL